MVTMQENYTEDKAVEKVRALHEKELLVICSQSSVVRALKFRGIRCIKNAYRRGVKYEKLYFVGETL
jgi:hypothetical protein